MNATRQVSIPQAKEYLRMRNTNKTGKLNHLSRKRERWTDYNKRKCKRWDLYNEAKSGWNVMAHGDAREWKWRRNWRTEWVVSTLHTTSEHGISSITIADAHTSAASSRMNWRPRRFKWTRPFRRKTKSGFCACAITFQTQSTLQKGSRSRFTWVRCVDANLTVYWQQICRHW
jgi:hypothetical protein